MANFTAAQREAKSRFWDAVKDNPLVDPHSLSRQKVAHLAGNQQVPEWLRDPAVEDWFFNRNTTKQLLEAAAEVAVRRLVDICLDPDMGPKGRVTAASVVNAAKTLLEYAGFAPPKMRVVEYKDKEIGAMDGPELLQYIEQHVGQLPSAKPDKEEDATEAG